MALLDVAPDGWEWEFELPDGAGEWLDKHTLQHPVDRGVWRDVMNRRDEMLPLPDVLGMFKRANGERWPSDDRVSSILVFILRRDIVQMAPDVARVLIVASSRLPAWLLNEPGLVAAAPG